MRTAIAARQKFVSREMPDAPLLR